MRARTRPPAAATCSLHALPTPPQPPPTAARQARPVVPPSSDNEDEEDDGEPQAPRGNWRAQPEFPAPSAAGEGFAAIDATSVDDILESPFAHVREIDSSDSSLVNYEIRKAHSTASQALTTPSPFARARARD